MFSVALSVASCLRAGTEVHVAWVVSSDNLPGLAVGDSVALTPGGGRMGALGGGILDSHLAELAVSGIGRVVDVTLSEVDALIAGLTGPASARIAVVPASSLPERTWGLLLNREALAISATVAEGRLSDIEVHTLSDAPPDEIAESLAGATGIVTVMSLKSRPARRAPRRNGSRNTSACSAMNALPSQPSAHSPVNSSIFGPSAAMWISTSVGLADERIPRPAPSRGTV